MSIRLKYPKDYISNNIKKMLRSQANLLIPETNGFEICNMHRAPYISLKTNSYMYLFPNSFLAYNIHFKIHPR